MLEVKTVVLTKQEVIDLILKMKNLNNREQAIVTYEREDARHPEWCLREAFEALKAPK